MSENGRRLLSENAYVLPVGQLALHNAMIVDCKQKEKKWVEDVLIYTFFLRLK
jgi:hypothetical protein